MKLTKKDKLAIQRLLSAGIALSNVAFNQSQQRGVLQNTCHDVYVKWDAAYSNAKDAIRKLQLPPF